MKNGKIRTLADLIMALGGYSAVARALRITPTAVQNWRLRDAVPIARRWQLLLLANKAGVEVRPGLLGFSKEDEQDIAQWRRG